MTNDILVDIVQLTDEIVDELVPVIVARLKTAGYSQDIHTIPLIAGIGLDIIERIATASEIEHPGMKRKIGWLAMKRIQHNLLTIS